MDFANLKSLTIPEGEVAEITCNGVLLWSAGRIPGEYQEVKHIRIPYGSYINTGWIPSNGSLLNVKFNAIMDYVFGCGSAPRLAASTSGAHVTLHNPTNTTNGIYTIVGKRNKVIEFEAYTSADFCYLLIDGEKTTRKQDAGYNWDVAFDTTLPLLLGAWNYGSTALRTGDSQWYYAKASVQGVDVFEMIPCYRKSDGVIGMYDLVSKTFFTNAGTGEFQKGADVGGAQPYTNLADTNSTDWLDNYRTSSSGIIEADGYSITNYIGDGQCLCGRKIYYQGINMSAQRLVFYNENKEQVYLAYPTVWDDKQGFDGSAKEGYIVVSRVNAALDNAYYVRLCGTMEYSKPIITIDEEIE